MEKKKILANCKMLYGNDPVTIGLRKEEIIREYFRDEISEVTVVDAPGSYELYQYHLEGQSLFAVKTAVVMENPFFIPPVPKDGSPAKDKLDEKKEKELIRFLDWLKNLSSDTLAIITVDFQPDKRLKAWKKITEVFGNEECSLLQPRDGASIMVRMLMDGGKRLEPEARAYLEKMVSSWEVISRPFLQTECDKIILMAGSRANISKKLLEYALPDYMDQGIFKFVDSLVAKNASAVMENTDHVFTDTPSLLKGLGFISSKFRKLKTLKEMQRNGVPLPQIQKKLGASTQWAWRNLQNEACSVSEADAEWMLVNLFEYHWTIRRGGKEMTGKDTVLLLRDLLLRYCMRK